MKLKFTILIIIAIFLSCEKKQEDITINKKASFSAEIAGKKISIIESDSLVDLEKYILWNPSRIKVIGGYDYVIDIWVLDLGHFIMLDSPIKNHISIDFVNHFDNSMYDENNSISKALFEVALSKGTKEYSKNFRYFPGIIIEWYDANGVKWSSNELFISAEKITTDVSSSENTFIISQSMFQDDLSDYKIFYQYLDLSFNCKLYDIDGHSIMLKNGKFKCIYKLFNYSK
jgi:hypothetical protein